MFSIKVKNYELTRALIPEKAFYLLMKKFLLI